MATFDPKAFIENYGKPAPQPAAPPVSQPAAQQAQPPVTQPSQAGGRGVIIPRQVSQEPDWQEQEIFKSNLKMYQEIANEGVQARRNSVEIDKLERILPFVQTGGVAAAKELLGRFGIKSEGLPQIQLYNSLVSKLVPQQRPPGSGVMSDADLALYRDSLPKLINSKEGNELIIESMKGINSFLQEEAKIAQLFLQRKIDAAQANEMMMNLKNPLDGFQEKLDRIVGESKPPKFRVIGVRPVNPSGGQ
ncbi:MAG: hypothetical protein ACO3UV_08770 [Pseudomonadales bacterium]